jgi:hypothetical protein
METEAARLVRAAAPPATVRGTAWTAAFIGADRTASFFLLSVLRRLETCSFMFASAVEAIKTSGEGVNVQELPGPSTAG